MDGKEQHHPVIPKAQAGWARYILLALVLEKIVQHVVVTLAFYFNWAAIRSTVAINPSLLMVLGAIVAVLFAVSFWGVMRQAKWGFSLVLALALFDIVGEFIAQETIMITFTASFFVATSLLILALFIVIQN